MIVIAAPWELGWSAPWLEWDLWAYLLRCYRVDRWIMTPITGVRKSGELPSLEERADLDTVLAENALPVVWVDEGGATDLREFEHPADAIYIFGKTSFRPMLGLGTPEHRSVRIATPDSGALLWGHQAAALVLHDRTVKQG